MKTQLFYGKTKLLEWDPHRFEWQGGERNIPLLEYTSQLGREMLKKQHILPNLVTKKWQGVLHHDFRLQWSSVWDKVHTRKEAELLWLIWHRAVAVNQWRMYMGGGGNNECSLCHI